MAKELLLSLLWHGLDPWPEELLHATGATKKTNKQTKPTLRKEINRPTVTQEKSPKKKAQTQKDIRMVTMLGCVTFSQLITFKLLCTHKVPPSPSRLRYNLKSNRAQGGPWDPLQWGPLPGLPESQKGGQTDRHTHTSAPPPRRAASLGGTSLRKPKSSRWGPAGGSEGKRGILGWVWKPTKLKNVLIFAKDRPG